MLVQRVLSAAVGLPILLAVTWIGDPLSYPVFSAAVALAVLAATQELYGLARQAGHAPLTWLGTAFALLLVGNAYVLSHFGRDLTLPLLTAGLVLPLIRLLLRRSFDGAWTDWAVTVVGALYTGGLLSYFVLLRQAENGLGWVLVALLVTFAADTSAFFVGGRIGRRKLAPLVSPNKTVEGAIGGLLGGMAATVTLVMLLGLPMPLLAAAGLGLVIALAAEVGDLAESMLKRSAHAKDASQLIPGHGGMLDRIDSLVFTVVVVYYYVMWSQGR